MSEDTNKDQSWSMSLPETIKKFKSLKIDLELASTVKTNIQKEYDFLRFNILPKLMDEQDITNMAVEMEGGGKPVRVRIQDEIYASIPAPLRPKAYEWLKENGLSELIIETVNASSLKALVKEKTEKGESLPEDLFKITFSPAARFY